MFIMCCSFDNFCDFLCFECELFLQLGAPPVAPYRPIRNAVLSCLELTDSTNVLLPFSVFTRRSKCQTHKAQTKPLSHLMAMFPLDDVYVRVRFLLWV